MNVFLKSKKQNKPLQINSKIHFGKFIGMYAKDVLKFNKGYFTWLSKNTDIPISHSLLEADKDFKTQNKFPR